MQIYPIRMDFPCISMEYILIKLLKNQIAQIVIDMKIIPKLPKKWNGKFRLHKL